MGLDQHKRFHRYHRVLSRASWSSREVSRILLGLLVEVLVPEGDPLVVGIDETLERRWGKKIQGSLGKGSKLLKPYTVWVGIDEVAGYLQGEARLAKATHAGEGHEPRRGQLTPYLKHILLTTHEAAPRSR
jgi:hypothetical protein